jgi:amino acid permease
MYDLRSTILALVVTILLIQILSRNSDNSFIEWAWAALVLVVLFSMLVYTRRGGLTRAKWRKIGGVLFLSGVVGAVALLCSLSG